MTGPDGGTGAPTHSVLCITYNQVEYVERAVRSLFLGSVWPDEVIIADDGSTDGTRDTLLRLQGEFPDRIRTILNPQNLGLFRNLNQLLPLPSGQLVHLLAGDDWYEAGMFERMNQEVVRRRLDPDEQSFILVPDTFTFDGEALTLHRASRSRLRHLFKSALRQQVQVFPVGISRRLFRHYGAFRPDLGLWADYLHLLTFLQHCEHAYKIEQGFPVYRLGSGISARTSAAVQSASFVAVLEHVRRDCQARLDASDRRFLNFLQRKHELIIRTDAGTCGRFLLASVGNVFNGVKRADLEIAASAVKRRLFSHRRSAGSLTS